MDDEAESRSSHVTGGTTGSEVAAADEVVELGFTSEEGWTDDCVGVGRGICDVESAGEVGNSESVEIAELDTSEECVCRVLVVWVSDAIEDEVAGLGSSEEVKNELDRSTGMLEGRVADEVTPLDEESERTVDVSVGTTGGSGGNVVLVESDVGVIGRLEVGPKLALGNEECVEVESKGAAVELEIGVVGSTSFEVGGRISLPEASVGMIGIRVLFVISVWEAELDAETHFR